MNITHRNAGPTGQLLSKKGQDQRNALIDDVVEFISFGDKASKYILDCLALAPLYPSCMDANPKKLKVQMIRSRGIS